MTCRGSPIDGLTVGTYKRRDILVLDCHRKEVPNDMSIRTIVSAQFDFRVDVAFGGTPLRLRRASLKCKLTRPSQSPKSVPPQNQIVLKHYRLSIREHVQSSCR